MTQFVTPAGRLVQGGVLMQAQKDMETNKPLMNDDGTPQMGVFMALAFPKLVNGQANPEFAAFWALLQQEAAQAWPSLFPQGASGPCINPRFSWKYQDGDGVDQNGKSVAQKPGFAGHHVIKFYSGFAVRCYNEGQFSPHQELQKPDDVIKRGDWVRIVGDVRGNNATGNQVPGISLYPSLVSFLGRDPAGRISSGPEAAAAFGGASVGYVPPGVSQTPVGAPAAGGVPAVGVPAVAVPGVPAVNVPATGVPTVGAPATGVPAVGVPAVNVPAVGIPAFNIPVPPSAPTYVVAPALAAQGVTLEALLAQGWTQEAAAAQGHIIKQ